VLEVVYELGELAFAGSSVRHAPIARLLTHQHHGRVGWTLVEHGLRREGVQATALAALDGVAQYGLTSIGTIG